jgi:hypothetical protein
LSRDLADAITAVMVALYGATAPTVSRGNLQMLHGAISDELIERAVGKLRSSDLLAVSFLDGVLRQTGPGLNAYAKGTYLALSLRREYIVPFSSPAIVHITVEGKIKPETGATGFYCAEVGNRLITAAHNIIGRKVLRVQDPEGKVIQASPIDVFPVVRGLDLAVVDTVAPAGVRSLKIEWDKEEIVELGAVYVAGFPKIPQQARAPRTWRSGELTSISMDYERRTSYLITNVTSEGFSGSPAINQRGLVIGVVAGQPDDRTSSDTSVRSARTGAEVVDAQQYDSQYSVLTPAWYIQDLLETGLPEN